MVSISNSVYKNGKKGINRRGVLKYGEEDKQKVPDIRKGY